MRIYVDEDMASGLLPWDDREAVLRRDAEIEAIRHQMQRAGSMNRPLAEGVAPYSQKQP